MKLATRWISRTLFPFARGGWFVGVFAMAVCSPATLFAQNPGRPDPARAADPCKTMENFLEAYPDYFLGETCPTAGDCDSPEVRDFWIPDSETLPTLIRLKFNVFRYDDGSDPAATQEEIDDQVSKLEQDFSPYKIGFVTTTEFVNSSEFRDLACLDCSADPPGQCRCFGPSRNAMKDAFADSPGSQLNIYVTSVPAGINGVGTFPWDSAALSNRGGIVVDEDAFGGMFSTLTHEIGHCLGLWHTFHGVSEFPENSDPCAWACYEGADGIDGDNTGDFAADTPPTPKSWACGAPGGIDSCTGEQWGETDYHNFMAYAADQSCRDRFSLQQSGRLHCWAQDVLSGWFEESDITIRLDIELAVYGPVSEYLFTATVTEQGEPVGAGWEVTLETSRGVFGDSGTPVHTDQTSASGRAYGTIVTSDWGEVTVCATANVSPESRTCAQAYFSEYPPPPLAPFDTWAFRIFGHGTDPDDSGGLEWSPDGAFLTGATHLPVYALHTYSYPDKVRTMNFNEPDNRAFLDFRYNDLGTEILASSTAEFVFWLNPSTGVQSNVCEHLSDDMWSVEFSTDGNAIVVHDEDIPVDACQFAELERGSCAEARCFSVFPPEPQQEIRRVRRASETGRIAAVATEQASGGSSAIALTGAGGVVHLWQNQGDDDFIACDWLPGGTRFVASGKGFGGIYNSTTGSVVPLSFLGRGRATTAIGTDRVAIGHDDKITVFAADDGQVLASWQGTNNVVDLAYNSHTGVVAAGIENEDILLFNLSDDQVPPILTVPLQIVAEAGASVVEVAGNIFDQTEEYLTLVADVDGATEDVPYDSGGAFFFQVSVSSDTTLVEFEATDFYQQSTTEMVTIVRPGGSVACCFDGETCQDLTVEDCSAQGGTSQGQGSTCFSTSCSAGACCYDDGTCSILDENTCLQTGGTIQGTSCDPDPCNLGACCFSDDSCELKSEANCVPVGAWNGADSCDPNPCEGPVYRVCIDGSGDFMSISAAISFAADGDVIELCDGQYLGPENRGLRIEGKSLTIRSARGERDACVIDCEWEDRAFEILGPDASGTLLRGFTIRNGSTSGHGGGIYIEDSAPAIQNLLIHGCSSALSSGAIYGRKASPTLTDLVLEANSGLNGGGMYLYDQSDAVLNNVQFIGNQTSGSPGLGGGLMFYQSTVNLTGVTFYGNSAGKGGAIYGHVAGTLLVSGATLASNTATEGASGIHLAGPSATIERSILSFGGGGDACVCEGGIAVFACSDVYGNNGGFGDWVGCIAGMDGEADNLAVDPKFCDLEMNDFALAANSPCSPDSSLACGLIGAWPAGCVSGIPEQLESAGLSLGLPKPNPFGTSSTIGFSIPASLDGEWADVGVYDGEGRRIRFLSSGRAVSGYHIVRWDGRDGRGDQVSAGVYFYRLSIGEHVVSRRAVRVR